MDNNLLTKNYLNQGYIISESLIDESEIFDLRNDLDKEFEEYKDGHSKKLMDFKNSELIQKIIKIYNSDKIKKIKSELKEISGTDVSLLPTFEVHKNYHINLKEFHGWHRDCGGELVYNYCKKILYKNDYLFSKVGIYLQRNNEYGGCIDLIKKSHKNFSNLKLILRKINSIPLKIITLLHKYLNNLYFLIPESFFMFLLRGKKLNPEKGSAVFFDSRITHRGSPISKKKLKDINYLKGSYRAVLPKKFDKYSIYCHFGNSEAVDSYMFDRLKRKNNKDELKIWTQEMKHISQYDKNFSQEINLVIEPVLKKYKEYL